METPNLNMVMRSIGFGMLPRANKIELAQEEFYAMKKKCETLELENADFKKRLEGWSEVE